MRYRFKIELLLEDAAKEVTDEKLEEARQLLNSEDVPVGVRATTVQTLFDNPEEEIKELKVSIENA